MSSEALERAEALLAVEPGSNVKSAAWWFAAARDMAREVAKLEAALAVAREREQRAENEIDLLRNVLKAADDFQAVGLPLNDEERTEYHNRRGHLLGRLEEYAAARAALVDEPAAATLAVPGRYQGGTDGEDSASAAADEPRQHIDHCVFHPDHEGPCEDDGEWVAAADEPGETPA